MPPNKADGLPAYQKIQWAIRERIESGDLRPGDLVESERDLARTQHVSLMTARHALTSLEGEGIVGRRRGIGTFVAAPKIHFNKLMSYTELMAGRSLVPGSKVLCLKIVDYEQDVTARLSLPPRSKLIKLEGLRHAAGEPFALETCYLRAAEFPDLLSEPLERESLFAFLERKYKVDIGYADEEIDATAADNRIADLLAINAGEPLLRLRQVIYSTKGKAIMYVLGFYLSEPLSSPIPLGFSVHGSVLTYKLKYRTRIVRDDRHRQTGGGNLSFQPGHTKPSGSAVADQYSRSSLTGRLVVLCLAIFIFCAPDTVFSCT